MRLVTVVPLGLVLTMWASCANDEGDESDENSTAATEAAATQPEKADSSATDPSADDKKAEDKKAEDKKAEDTDGDEPLTGATGRGCEPKATGKPCGHRDGPLRQRKSRFYGLIRSGADLQFQDGRRLIGHTPKPKSPRQYAVGEIKFSKSEFYFDRHRLRVHRLYDTELSSSKCTLASKTISEEYGTPVMETDSEKRWSLDWIEIIWADTSARENAMPPFRCQLEFRDREWLSAQ